MTAFSKLLDFVNDSYHEDKDMTSDQWRSELHTHAADAGLKVAINEAAASVAIFDAKAKGAGEDISKALASRQIDDCPTKAFMSCLNELSEQRREIIIHALEKGGKKKEYGRYRRFDDIPKKFLGDDENHEGDVFLDSYTGEEVLGCEMVILGIDVERHNIVPYEEFDAYAVIPVTGLDLPTFYYARDSIGDWKVMELAAHYLRRYGNLSVDFIETTPGGKGKSGTGVSVWDIKRAPNM